MASTDANTPATVLVVCSANQCRSPLVAALLDCHAAERGAPIRVTSAGVDADGASGATAGTVRVARDLDIDLDRHRSRRVTREMIEASDLALGMERLHVRAAAVLSPMSFPRVFTLKELVRRGTALGPRRRETPLGAWLQAAHSGRRAANLLGASPEDDLEDPTTSRATDHETLAAEVDQLTRRLVDLAWPSDPPRA